MPDLYQRILDALPQTQCTRCGYPDCAGYAQAIAQGEAPINQCPPGGAEGITRLAAITGQAAAPLDPANGVEGSRAVAIIDEQWCIGCTLCLPPCPTDAIIGSNKRMHSVIAQHCTGCELCLPACPVDCIRMEVVTGESTGWNAWSRPQADTARERYAFHVLRLARDAEEGEQRREDKAVMKLVDLEGHSQITNPDELQKKRAVIEAALARARERKAAQPK